MISYSSKKSKLSNSKVQTIIITRDELQNKLYGAWYPSLTVLQYGSFMTKELRNKSKSVIIISKCDQNESNKCENNKHNLLLPFSVGQCNQINSNQMISRKFV